MVKTLVFKNSLILQLNLVFVAIVAPTQSQVLPMAILNSKLNAFNYFQSTSNNTNLVFCVPPGAPYSVKLLLQKIKPDSGILVVLIKQCISDNLINSLEISEHTIMTFFALGNQDFGQACNKISKIIYSRRFIKKTMPTFIVYFEQFGNQTNKRIPKPSSPFPINVRVFVVLLRAPDLKVFTPYGTAWKNFPGGAHLKDEMLIPGYFNVSGNGKQLQLRIHALPKHIIGYVQHGNYNLPYNDTWYYTSYLLFRDLKTLLNFNEMHLNVSRNVYLFTAFKAGVDIQVTQKILTSKTVSEYQYLHATYSTKTHLFLIQPSSQSLRNIFLAPFMENLWLATILSYLFVLSAFAVILRFDHRDKHNLGLSDSILWLLSAICQQGWYRSPSTFKLRAICAAALLTTLTLYLSYSAAIISQFEEVIEVTSLKELIKQDFVIASSKSRASVTAITNIREAMWNTSKIHVTGTLVSDDENVMDMIQSERIAFLSYPHNFYYNVGKQGYNRSGLCKSSLSEVVDTVKYPEAMAIPKGSPYKELLNQKILTVIQKGLFHRYSSNFDKNSELSCGTRQMPQPVRYQDIFMAYIIIGGGLLLGIISLAIEISLNIIGRIECLYYPGK